MLNTFWNPCTIYNGFIAYILLKELFKRPYKHFIPQHSWHSRSSLDLSTSSCQTEPDRTSGAPTPGRCSKPAVQGWCRLATGSLAWGWAEGFCAIWRFRWGGHPVYHIFWRDHSPILCLLWIRHGR